MMMMMISGNIYGSYVNYRPYLQDRDRTSQNQDLIGLLPSEAAHLD